MNLPPSRFWSDIPWPDFADGRAAQWIAVLPLAATEQHGPHLPLATDVVIAQAYLAAVHASLPASVPAVFLPIEEIGISTEHTNFPGTLSLTPEAALAQWRAIGESVARTGIRKLVMVTSHGGNSAAMDLVALDLRARLGMLVVTTGWHRFGYPANLFDRDEMRHGIHGGAIETAIMLAAAPDQVDMGKAADFVPASRAMADEFRWLNTLRPAPFAWMMEDLHPSGAAGNATRATADKGRALIAHGARGFCELLGEMQAFDLARFGSPSRT
jgi:creatinine amidohydrolase